MMWNVVGQGRLYLKKIYLYNIYSKNENKIQIYKINSNNGIFRNVPNKAMKTKV
jgi:hypothetical protein